MSFGGGPGNEGREEQLQPGEAREPSVGALSEALAAVGDRWTLLVIAALLDGPRRFGELTHDVAGIAPNVLAQRLRRLEGNGLLVAHLYQERPPRFAYELTEAGAELSGVIRLLSAWASRRAPAEDGVETPRHAVCGTALEARWWCPVCERPADEDAAEDLHFA